MCVIINIGVHMCLNIFLGGNPMNAHSKEKEKLAREALGLWALYGERYRNTPELYSALLSSGIIQRAAVGENGIRTATA